MLPKYIKYKIGDKAPISISDEHYTEVTIRDICYSIKSNKWYYQYSWYENSIESGTGREEVKQFQKNIF